MRSPPETSVSVRVLNIDSAGRKIIQARRAHLDVTCTMDIYKRLFWKQATESMSRKAHAWTERIHNYLTSTDGFSTIPNGVCRQVRHHDLVVGHLQHRTTYRTLWPKSVVPIPRISIHIFLSRRVKIDQ